MGWVRQLRFAQPAQEATRLDYLHEVEHMAERITRLKESIREAVQQAPPQLRAVVQGLQAMRGIALISAVTIASEIQAVSRGLSRLPGGTAAALACPFYFATTVKGRRVVWIQPPVASVQRADLVSSRRKSPMGLTGEAPDESLRRDRVHRFRDLGGKPINRQTGNT